MQQQHHILHTVFLQQAWIPVREENWRLICCFWQLVSHWTSWFSRVIITDICWCLCWTHHSAQRTTWLCPLLGHSPVLYSHLIHSFQAEAQSLKRSALGSKIFENRCSLLLQRDFLAKEWLNCCSTVMVKLLTRGCKIPLTPWRELSNSRHRIH